MRRLSRLLLVVVGIFTLSATASAQTRFLGSISLVPYNFAPVGTAFCNGQLLPIAEYAALFDLLGTTYGGDGISTFALPDLRGRVAIGQGESPGTSNYVIGEIGGEESVTLNVNQIPSHNHTAYASTSFANTASPAGAYWAPRPRTLLFAAPSSPTLMDPVALGFGPAGGDQPHENRKPFLTLNYVIHLFGIFPSE